MMSWKKMSMILFCFCSSIQGMENQPSYSEILDVDSEDTERNSSTFQMIAMDGHILIPSISQVVRVSHNDHVLEDGTLNNTTIQRLVITSRPSDVCTTRQTVLCCGGMILLVAVVGILNWLHTAS